MGEQISDKTLRALVANWAPGAQRSSQGYYRGLAVRAMPLEAPGAAPHEAGSESVTGGRSPSQRRRSACCEVRRRTSRQPPGRTPSTGVALPPSEGGRASLVVRRPSEAPLSFTL